MLGLGLRRHGLLVRQRTPLQALFFAQSASQATSILLGLFSHFTILLGTIRRPRSEPRVPPAGTLQRFRRCQLDLKELIDG